MTHITILSPHQTDSPYWDRGFLYAESIYDVIPFYERRPYTLDEHYERFMRDLRLMKFSCTLTRNAFHDLLMQAISETSYSDGAVYVQATSGNPGKRMAMPEDSEVHLIIHAFHYPRPSLTQLMSGIKLTLYPESRGTYCFVKSTNRLTTRLAMLHAKEQGATEAIWFCRDSGRIHESAASNIFFIQGQTLLTPALSSYIFPGLAREKVLQLAERQQIHCVVRDIHVNELDTMDAAFITGSTKQLVPVRHIDHRSYSVHPLWIALFKGYNQDIDRFLAQPS